MFRTPPAVSPLPIDNSQNVMQNFYPLNPNLLNPDNPMAQENLLNPRNPYGLQPNTLPYQYTYIAPRHSTVPIAPVPSHTWYSNNTTLRPNDLCRAAKSWNITFPPRDASVKLDAKKFLTVIERRMRSNDIPIDQFRSGGNEALLQEIFSLQQSEEELGVAFINRMQCAFAQLEEPLPENRQVRIIIQKFNFQFLSKFAEEPINTYSLLYKRVSSWQSVIDTGRRNQTERTTNNKSKTQFSNNTSKPRTRVNAVTDSDLLTLENSGITTEDDERTTPDAIRGTSPPNPYFPLKKDPTNLTAFTTADMQAIVQVIIEKLQLVPNSVTLPTICGRCGRTGHIADVCCSRTTDEIRARAGLPPFEQNMNFKKRVGTLVAPSTPTLVNKPAVATDIVSPLIVKLADLTGNSLDIHYLNDLKTPCRSNRQPLLQNMTESTIMSSITSSDTGASLKSSQQPLIFDSLTKTLVSDLITPSHSYNNSLSSSPEPASLPPSSLPTHIRANLTTEGISQMEFGRIPRPAVQHEVTTPTTTKRNVPATETTQKVAVTSVSVQTSTDAAVNDSLRCESLQPPSHLSSLERPAWVDALLEGIAELRKQTRVYAGDLKLLQQYFQVLNKKFSFLQDKQMVDLASDIREVAKNTDAVSQRVSAVEPEINKLGTYYQEKTVHAEDVPAENTPEIKPTVPVYNTETTRTSSDTSSHGTVVIHNGIRLLDYTTFYKAIRKTCVAVRPTIINQQLQKPWTQTVTTQAQPLFNAETGQNYRQRDHKINQCRLLWQPDMCHICHQDQVTIETCFRLYEKKKRDHFWRRCQKCGIPIQLFNPQCRACNIRWPGVLELDWNQIHRKRHRALPQSASPFPEQVTPYGSGVSFTIYHLRKKKSFNYFIII
uniref:CCHC-type domain-containing protein n=1 Tax=Glyptapanteles flavicoxis TaxID=463051 RepID=B7S8P7_9HYME|nr:hypothetical protein GFP_L5_0200 [Glyptapanteles flavicoxis]